MTTAQKYPDDFEDIIYQSMLSMESDNGVVHLPDVIKLVSKRVKAKNNPESVFIFMKRMCEEGMVEKVSHNHYKAIEFDPNFSFS